MATPTCHIDAVRAPAARRQTASTHPLLRRRLCAARNGDQESTGLATIYTACGRGHDNVTARCHRPGQHHSGTDAAVAERASRKYGSGIVLASYQYRGTVDFHVPVRVLFLPSQTVSHVLHDGGTRERACLYRR